MSALPVVKLLTVDEGREIAGQHENIRYELHHGELVQMTQPKYSHQLMQCRMGDLLRLHTGAYGKVLVKLGFRAVPEYESRSADVALLSFERHRQALDKNEVFGAPDLVIEVLSPSNRAGEMDDKEALCLAHGCLSFWLINPVRRTVKVTNPDRPVRWYAEGDTIPLAPFADTFITVAEIFAPLT